MALEKFNMISDGLESQTYGGDINILTGTSTVSYSIQEVEISKNSHNFNEIHVPLEGMEVKGSSASYIKSENKYSYIKLRRSMGKIWDNVILDCRSDSNCVGQIDNIDTALNYIINNIWNFQPHITEKEKYVF